MAKTVKTPKTKFPADRELKSKSNKESKITYYRYTTAPKLDISIEKDLPDHVIGDLKSAIDDILNYHGL